MFLFKFPPLSYLQSFLLSNNPTLIPLNLTKSFPLSFLLNLTLFRLYKMCCLRSVSLSWKTFKCLKSIRINLIFFSILWKHLMILVNIWMIRLNVLLLLFYTTNYASTSTVNHLSRSMSNTVTRLRIISIYYWQFLLWSWFLHIIYPWLSIW